MCCHAPISWPSLVFKFSASFPPFDIGLRTHHFGFVSTSLPLSIVIMAPNTSTGSPFAAENAQHPAESLVIRPQTSLRLDLDIGDACQDDVESKCAVRPHTGGVQPKEIPDWSNLSIIHRNTLPPRSHYFLYDSEDDALKAQPRAARSLLLSGLWGFDLSDSPFNGPRGFYKPAFNNTKWPLVKVPGMWLVSHSSAMKWPPRIGLFSTPATLTSHLPFPR